MGDFFPPPPPPIKPDTLPKTGLVHLLHVLQELLQAHGHPSDRSCSNLYQPTYGLNWFASHRKYLDPTRLGLKLGRNLRFDSGRCFPYLAAVYFGVSRGRKLLIKFSFISQATPGTPAIIYMTYSHYIFSLMLSMIIPYIVTK